MARDQTPPRAESVAAQVFLRSVSGRSVRELGSGSAPADLAPLRAPVASREAVERFLTAAGFKVYGDEMGLSLSIEGRPAAFAKAFGVEAERLGRIAATETVSLEVPATIRALVDEIVVLPKPELFRP
jgi:hypothetical protein